MKVRARHVSHIAASRMAESYGHRCDPQEDGHCLSLSHESIAKGTGLRVAIALEAILETLRGINRNIDRAVRKMPARKPKRRRKP